MASAYLATACPPSSPCRVNLARAHRSTPTPPPQLQEPRRFTNPGDSGWTFEGTVTPRRYVLGWADGVVKIGACLSNDARRIRDLAARGGSLIHLGFYALDDAHAAESWLHGQAAIRWPQAFACRHEAALHLGANGGGWTECFRVPLGEHPTLMRLAEV